MPSCTLLADGFIPLGVRKLAAASSSYIYLWSISGPNPVRLATPDGVDLMSIGFDPRNGLLAGCDQHFHVYLWNPATGTVVATITSRRAVVVQFTRMALAWPSAPAAARSSCAPSTESPLTRKAPIPSPHRSRHRTGPVTAPLPHRFLSPCRLRNRAR